TAHESDRGSQLDIEEVQRKLVLLQIGYVHALRHHLRGTAPWDDLAGLIPDQDIERLRTQSNVPLAIQQNIASILSRCYHRRWIDGIRWASLNRTLGSLMDSQGASERIKNTPMPPVYELFIRLSIRVFCVLLPLGMVEGLGLWTPLGSTL